MPMMAVTKCSPMIWIDLLTAILDEGPQTNRETGLHQFLSIWETRVAINGLQLGEMPLPEVHSTD